MLCITMEVEPRIAKQYKCQEKEREGGKKGLCVISWWSRRLQVRGKNVFWGIL